MPSRESAFSALLVAPFFTSAVAPGAKPSRLRHHALGGTSLAPSPVHSFELANSQDDSKRPRLPVCFSCMSADEAVPSQGPQGRRSRAGARPRSLGLDPCINRVHQPGWRMHAVLVEGEGGLETEVREKRSKEDWTLEDLHGERPSIIIRSGKGWECSVKRYHKHQCCCWRKRAAACAPSLQL